MWLQQFHIILCLALHIFLFNSTCKRRTFWKNYYLVFDRLLTKGLTYLRYKKDISDYLLTWKGFEPRSLGFMSKTLRFRTHLADGEYEVVLKEKDLKEIKCSPKKNSTWEAKPPGENDDQLEIFENSASLKFRLSWTREPAGALVERPRPLMPRGLNQQHHNHSSSQQLNGITEGHGKKDKKNKHLISKTQNLNPPRIIYQVRLTFHIWRYNRDSSTTTLRVWNWSFAKLLWDKFVILMFYARRYKLLTDTSN